MQKLMNIKYLLFGIMLVLSAVLVLTFCVRSNTAVSADYLTDVLGNPNAVVNFNQYVENGNFSSNQYWSTENGVSITTDNNIGTITSVNNSSGIYQNASTIVNGHHYYAFYSLRSSSNSNLIVNICGNSSSVSITNDFVRYDKLVIANSQRLVGIYVGTANSGFDVKNVCVIDLDVMFGSDNLPNLQQCRELFVSDYYSYNSGTAMPISGLNSYQQGYNDALSSFNVVRSGSDVINGVYNVNASYFSLGSYGSYSEIRFGGGVIAIPLGITLLVGDTISIDLPRMTLPELSSSDNYFSFGYMSGGTFLPFANYSYHDFTRNQQGGLVWYSGSVSFSITSETNILYVRNITPGTSTDYVSMAMRNFTFTIHTYNAYSAQKQQYDLGYQRAEEYYKSLLESYQGSNGEGGSSYMDIYNDGYNVGLNANVSESRKKTYTFSAFLGALFDVPVRTINSLLDFNVFGFNMKNFAMSIITISIVFAVVSIILRSKHS